MGRKIIKFRDFLAELVLGASMHTYILRDVVLPEYEAAMQELWQPDHMNYTWLGNLFHLHKGHGHMHLIPRYKDPRTFAGMDFADTRWGNNYVPYPQEAAPMDVRLAIRDALRDVLIERVRRA
jgi:diadenosine tetraphosphate (Ap4A) HIT family hydrolase